MAATQTNASYILQAASPASPQTASVGVGSGANRQYVIFIMWAAGFDLGVTSVTVGTDAMAPISGTALTSGVLQIVAWGGALTVTGSQTVTVTFSNTPSFSAMYGEVIAGSDLINNGTSLTDAASPANVAMTSQAGDLTATAILTDTAGGVTTNANSLGAEGTNGVTSFDYGNGAANPTHVWTTTGANWTNAVLAGVNFRAAPTGQLQPTVAGAVLSGVLGVRSVGTRLTPATP
jgi:hypothetical protein